MTNLNDPVNTLLLFIVLIAILIVNIMMLVTLRSFLPPKEPRQDKQHIDSISFKR